jgi:glycine cleavage system H lipoate-binding protein/ABC-type phosphate transport system substrate-binding protein
MKTTITMIISFILLLFCGSVSSKEVSVQDTDLQKESVNITCTPDLYELSSKWAREYGSLFPETKIRVIHAAYNNAYLGKDKNLSFISDKSPDAIQNKTNWKMVVGHDITVPVINLENPYLSEIIIHGISPEMFAQILQNPEKQNWGTLVSGGQNFPIHIYMTGDESVKSGVAKFAKAAEMSVSIITIGKRDELIPAIQKDPNGIGFFKVVDIMSPENQSLIENLRLLPIDKNGNGRIDHMEDIYSDLNDLFRGVWIGKYPKSLYSDIYAVSKVQPSNESELSFLKWILTDGQKLMFANGYSDLVNSESQSQLDKITAVVVSASPTKDASQTRSIAFITAMLLIAGIIINTAIRHYRITKTAINGTPIINKTGFEENSVVVPRGLYFDKTHTWAFMGKDGTVAVGLDDFLQHITGPITRVEMKNPGEVVKKGELLFSIIQKGKQLKIYAPVSGIILENNEALIGRSSYINSSPYSDGWVYKIEPDNWFKEMQLLDIAEKYKRWIDTEFTRVKDFLAATLKHDNIEYAYIVLQDGGNLKDGILSDFGPKTWEDFQTHFLDNYK